MKISFVITGSITATTLECKCKCKKVTNFTLTLKTNRILQQKSLCFIMQLILVRIWRDNWPKYGRAVTKFFLGTVLTTGFCASILSKNS